MSLNNIVCYYSLLIFLFLSLFFPCLGLKASFMNFLIFFLGLAVTALSASAMCFAISATVKIFAIANLSVALGYVLMMVSQYSDL